MIDDGRAYFVIRRKHPSQNMSSLLKVSNEPNLKYIYSSLSKIIWKLNPDWSVTTKSNTLIATVSESLLSRMTLISNGVTEEGRQDGRQEWRWWWHSTQSSHIQVLLISERRFQGLHSTLRWRWVETLIIIHIAQCINIIPPTHHPKKNIIYKWLKISRDHRTIEYLP